MNVVLEIEDKQEVLVDSDTGEVLATRKVESFTEPTYRRQVDWFFLYHYACQKGCTAAASLLDAMANNVYMNNVLRDNPALLDHTLPRAQFFKALAKLKEDGIVRVKGKRMKISPIYVWYGDYGARDRAISDWYTGRYSE